jgi:uncharacterized protein (TIGR02145 family)
MIKNRLLLFIVFTVISSFGNTQTVTIGKQVWLTKNLDVSTFRNGETILEAKTKEEWISAGENKQAVWCYHDNNPENGTKYGKLYNWYAVNDSRGLAPKGYHIPTDQEWTVFSNFLGGERVAGKKMKSSSGWIENGIGEGNGKNKIGFSGFPGGYRLNNGDFSSLGGTSEWWSASELNESRGWCRRLGYVRSSLGRLSDDKRDGYSVRCIKD